MVLKQILTRFAAAAGYEAFESWRLPSLQIARKVALLFDHFKITCVLDIGANRGQYRDFLRKEVDFSGPIYSFEPDPQLSEALIKRAVAEDRNWKIFPIALGRYSETRLLNKMVSTPFNSFLEPVSGLPPMVARDNTVADKCLVEIRRLDDFASELEDLRHTFVKIDTQGFDLEVLAGGGQVIRKVPMLQTELSWRPIYRGMPSFGEAIEAFHAEGLAVSDLFLVFSDEHFRAYEFDCIMVRQDPRF